MEVAIIIFVFLEMLVSKMLFPRGSLDPFWFQKVREAGSFHPSNFRQKRMAWYQVMTKKTKKLTPKKVTTNFLKNSWKFPRKFPAVSREVPGNFPEISLKFPEKFLEIS